LESLDNRPDNVYSEKLKAEYDRQYEIAKIARAKGLDPSLKVESDTTYDLADRVEKSVGPVGVAERIRELRKQISREETALKVSEEIVLGRFGRLGEEDAATQAVRTALAILDEAVTVAPIQGIHKVRVKQTQGRQRHLAIYFAGPMRAAGGTEMGLTLIVGDHIRRKLNIPAYRATEQEAKRFVEELRLYERAVNRFQYRNSDDALREAFLKLPIEPDGVETDPVEVAVNRNVPGIDTNRVRGGSLRVVNDGLLGRSQKVLRIVEKLGLEGWEWLLSVKMPSAEDQDVKEFMFMEDVVGGRPIFAFPGQRGGFRIRYGRARNTGLSSIGLHPSTMEILGGFPAIGIQMKTERPGKGGIVAAVDSIEPAIVKLKDGSIVRPRNPEEARAIKGNIAKILFTGDLLVAYGEFLENNKSLTPSGFVEEWWAQILGQKTESAKVKSFDSIPPDRLQQLVEEPYRAPPTAFEALTLSKGLGIPLHPFHSFFWENISLDELRQLRLAIAEPLSEPGASKLIFARTQFLESILEKLCAPHQVHGETVVFDEEESTVLRAIFESRATLPETGSALEALSLLAGFPIMRKSPVYVGARMGRPEKAKERVMTPRVHVIFPAGQLGGSRRDIVEASRKALTELEVVNRFCPSCNSWQPHMKCPSCGVETEAESFCPKCGQTIKDFCPNCRLQAQALPFRRINVNLEQILSEASKHVGLQKPPEMVKGVKGLANANKFPESIEKGLLRAKWDVSVFKDGTLRFDATNAVLTHFRPGEIGLSVEKAQALGYNVDHTGKPLTQPNQLCLMEIQDLVVSEGCGDYLVKAAQFLDDLLHLYYGTDRIYRVKTRQDLIGHLVVGLSPHTSVGVVARIVGFTKASVCYAHPLFHAAKRRDCDGDEDSVSLLLDILLNFSREYLPDRIGGLMDAPLLLAPLLNPVEVARQAFNIEVESRLPVEFYNKTLVGADPKEMEEIIPTLNRSLASPNGIWKIGFTHPTENINNGQLTSSYKELPSMLEQVKAQLALADMTLAVRGEEVARKVLSTHILRDLVGNLRTYTSQHARCLKCGYKPRRPPLEGKCTKCGGKLGATVFKAGVEKYLEVATDLVQRYDVGAYYSQRLELIKMELAETFKPPVEDREQQKLLVGDYA
jgi:DNA polymerase II large subunit